jgi:hypothetical protein
MIKKITLPQIPIEERTPVVGLLLSIISQQSDQIQALKDQVAILRGEKPKPKFPKSNLEGKEAKPKDSKQGKRKGSEKRSKTVNLEIHEIITLAPSDLKDDWIFKGWHDFVVQGLIIGE